MKAAIAFLTSPLVVSLIGLIAIAVLIWFGGPLIAIDDKKPLLDEMHRLIAILVVTILWGVNNFRLQNKENKKGENMMNDFADIGGVGKNQPISPENGILQERFQQALGILKQSRKAQKKGASLAFHDLPWYIMIGPPGSGKTTALINSGLRFPLAQKMGQQPLNGIGGTRYCDWWFSDEAVLIDTAGRYTTQDSDQSSDKGAWAQFLKLLAKHRPVQPINGALVVISLADIMRQSETECLHHANLVRQRLQELQVNLGMQFPIYVIFTKADLIAGFNEFFDNLSRSEKDQCWGMTFPLEQPPDGHFELERYQQEFNALLMRLNQRMQWRLNEERDTFRRTLLFGFPTEFAALKGTTGRFLDTLFESNIYESGVNVRGIYFTSGTQEGTPFDQVLGALAADFGLDRQQIPMYSGQGKSYFLTQVFKDVIFPEASLAGMNRSRAGLQTWGRRVAIASAFLVTGGLIFVWTTHYTRVNQQVTTLHQYVNNYRQSIVALGKNDLEPVSILPAFDALQQAQSVAKENVSGWFSYVGLSEVDSLDSQTEQAYFRVLISQFLPRLIHTTESFLSDPTVNPEALLVALKVYIMLGTPEKLDNDYIKNWFDQHWAQQLAGGANKHQALMEHLQMLLDNGFIPINLNQQILVASRIKLQQIPLSKRIYSHLKDQAKSRIDDFFLNNELPLTSQQTFTNKQNPDEPLQGIPGFYTEEGYDRIFLEQSLALAKNALQDVWIYGEEDSPSNLDPDTIHAELESLYIKDFIKYWTRLYNSIKMPSLNSIQETVDVLESLAGPDKALETVIDAIIINTDLRARPTTLQKAGGVLAKNRIGGKAAKKARKATKKINKDTPLTLVGERLTRHFKELIALNSSADGKPATLATYTQSLTAMQNYLLAIADAAEPDDAALIASIQRMQSNGQDAIGKLNRHLRRLPSPVKQWVASLTDSAWRLMLRTSRTQINNLWKNNVIPRYQQDIENRYPVFKNAQQQLNIDSFARFFAPSGVMSEFVGQHIDPFIKKSAVTWKLKTLEGRNLSISRANLQQLRRSHTILKAYFPEATKDPVVKFQFKPQKLDRSVSKAVLSMDGNKFFYQHGPAVFTEILQWPYEDPERSRASLSFDTNQGQFIISRSGAWAIFKLLETGRIKRIKRSNNRFAVKFVIEDKTAIYELRAASSLNPFNLNGVHLFRCPSTL